MEIEWDAKGKSGKFGKERSEIRMIWGEIHSFVHRINVHLANFQPNTEIRTVLFDMNDEVLDLMNKMKRVQSQELATENRSVKGIQLATVDKGESVAETLAPGKLYFLLKLLLNTVKEFHTELVQIENRGAYSLEYLSVTELFPMTQESLIITRARFSLDTAKGAKEGDKTSPRISNSELEIGEAKGRVELSRRISNSELKIGLAKEMEVEAKGRDEVGMMREERFFEIYCRVLEANCSRVFSSPSTRDTTSLSSMYFTHSTTGCTRYAAFAGSTLQIYSIEVTKIKDALGLQWPLHVYGIVAARDVVDGSRNTIFLRHRDDYQILTQEHSRLHLTGPSRAIVATDGVDFDIELRVRGRAKSKDSVLMSRTFKYSSIYCSPPITLFGEFCQIALQFEKLENTVQATIAGVRVTESRRTWPFKYGGLVTCVSKGFSKPGELGGTEAKPDVPKDKHELSKEVVLEDQVMADRSDGYVDLSRHVVSVELGGKLEVIITEWSETRAFIKHRFHVFFEAQKCKTSQKTCYLGHSKVEVTVAWSLLLQDQGEAKGRDELSKETRDSLTEIKVETEIKARDTDEAPHIISLDAVSGAKGMDEVSPRISTSGLEIEEANEMGRETEGGDEAWLRILDSGLDIEEERESEGGDEVWLRILDSGLDIEEDKDMGGEANGVDEVSPRISTSTETKLGMEEAKGMQDEADMDRVLTDEEFFDEYRCGWVSNWSAFCGTFTETTTLSPMQFTHCTPGHAPFAAFVSSTLQMYSIKVTEIKEALGLNWPLKVYGVVAARDTVDRNRNIIFSRQRDDYQELNKEDPFLRLTGPSRAIVTEEPVHLEIELKVKGGTKSEDRVLMSWDWYYSDRLCTLYTPLAGEFCTLALSSEELEESVQATIVGVHVTKGELGLFKYGGRIVCSSPPRKGILPDSKHTTAPSFRQVVLGDGAMDVCSKGYLALSRHVVSVELCGRLEVHIYAYSPSRGIAEHGRVSIKAQNCNITQHKCCLGDSELEISVAWSRLVRDKQFISLERRVEL